jgi:small-conductance mechanosensitive channel
VKRGAVVMIFAGMGLIWATEIQTMALSLTAIAVAIVIATKEMLLCVMGAILRASAGSFTVGDRIEIDGRRGDVIDHGLFATTIIEVGAGHRWTGRALTVPNSVMLTSTVINETYSHAYVLHLIAVPIDADVDIDEAEKVLVEVGKESCEPYFEDASESLIRGTRARGLEPPQTEPHVIVEVPGPSRRTLMLRIPVPVRDKGDIEQVILRRFLSWLGSRPVAA